MRHLEKLEERNVFSIEKRNDDLFLIWEACDCYYSQRFTAAELRELAQEILDVANGGAHA